DAAPQPRVLIAGVAQQALGGWRDAHVPAHASAFSRLVQARDHEPARLEAPQGDEHSRLRNRAAVLTLELRHDRDAVGVLAEAKCGQQHLKFERLQDITRHSGLPAALLALLVYADITSGASV